MASGLPALVAAASKVLKARHAAQLARTGPRLLLYLLLLLLGLLFFLVLIVLLPLLLLIAAATSAQQSCGDPAGAGDPIDLPALEIATRIYQVGNEMGLGEREILTAYTVALVESGGGATMSNVQGGDRTSTGVFQQQNFPEWTVGAKGEPRNRNNVADAARTFFERLGPYDHGQAIGELAADIQRPRRDLRWKYGAALPRARYFLARVKSSAKAESVGDGADLAGLAAPGGCGNTSGPQELARAVTLKQPRKLAKVPARYTGGASASVDARILDNVIFIAEQYDVIVTQGLGRTATGSPSTSHNYGTAVDLVPAGNRGSLPEWRRTTERLAGDLGWRGQDTCAASGSKPACPLVPAIRGVYYNGFRDGQHGDPAHTGNAHLHISWDCSCGPYDGADRGLSTWVKAFPASGPGGRLP